MRRIGLLSVVLAAIACAAAAEPHRDLSWSYFARETEAGRDNDIARFTYGQTEAGMRFAISTAFRNEDNFHGPYPVDLMGEYLRFWESGLGITGVGARIGWVEDRETTLEIGLGRELRRERWTLRGTVGVQAISGPGRFNDGRRVSGFLVGEGTYYLWDQLALKAGATLDDSDLLGTVGVEYGPRAWPVHFFLDWALAVDGYRGEDGYNDLVGGIRYSRALGGLKARHRAAPAALLARPVDIQ